jgi:hypothetical protein
MTIILGGDSLNETFSPKEQDVKYMFIFLEFFLIDNHDVRVW